MKWRSVKLGEITEMKYGKLPPKETSVDERFPIFTGYRIAGYCNEFLYDESEVVVVARGVGGTGDVKMSPEKCWITNLSIVLKVDSECIDKRFLFYRLGQEPLKDKLNTGAAQAQITIENLQPYTITVPGLAVQERIASILSAYDDAIENNRRRMELLEKAARLLYEEWFVRLRFPGHEHTPVTRGLPQGWERMQLEEVAEFRLGKMLDQEKNRGDFLPYLANVNVRWGSFDLENLREMRFEHDELETFGLKYGDIVMCEGGEPGRCAVWKEEKPGMMIQKAIHRIRCRNGMHYEYLYQCLRKQGTSGQLATLFTGATIKHLPREKLAKVTVIVPPAQLMDLFVDYSRPIENQIRTLALQNQKLRAARDLLLPGLMSGEIGV